MASCSVDTVNLPIAMFNRSVLRMDPPSDNMAKKSSVANVFTFDKDS